MNISVKDHLDGNFPISKNIVSVQSLSVWWINVFHLWGLGVVIPLIDENIITYALHIMFRV